MSGNTNQQGAFMRCAFRFHTCAVCLIAGLIAISGCAVDYKQEPTLKPPINESPILPTLPEPADKSEREEVQETAVPLPGSGQTAWARGFEGDLIKGLDGEVYLPYNAETIRRVQQVMKTRGLYAGPLNGVLDVPTMESIYAFQQANYYLLRCGVPTPRTRMLLEQGSHTDIASRDRNHVHVIDERKRRDWV